MNEFFAKAELLAGLSETEQTELRTNIGLNTIIDDLSNDTVNTKGLTVSDGVFIDTSNLQLKLGEMTSNMFLKSVTSDGKAVWSPLPTYDEMIGATMDAITQDLFDDLSKLRNLKVEDRLHIQCNLTQPSVLVNEDSNGLVSWSQLESNFETCNLSSNNIPNMLALGDLYELTLLNDSNIYSNLYEVATDTSLVLTLSNNLSELSNNLPEIMSNLGLDINFTTSNLLTSNVFASNIEADSIIAKTLMAEQSRTSNLLVHDDATVSGMFQSKYISASNVSYSNLLQGKDILASNISIRSSLLTSNLSTSNITTSNVSLKNIYFDMPSASNNEVLTIMNSNLAFKKLNSDYLANSENSIPSSKALSDALQFMDTRVRTITNDPTFAETYIQINCNLDEIKYYTVENMLKLHSNLRISKLAREPTWENVENIPSDLANLSDFYLTKDLSNIDLGDINVLKLRSSLALEEMAYQKNDSVDISGGFIKASRVETDNFLMTDSEDNVEDDRINYRDENYLFMRHAGYEGENVPGTGKWGNLPIKQYYTDVGKHSIPSCEALSNLYTYLTSSDRTAESMNENGETIAQFKQGFLNQAYSNQNSTSNAASTKALTDLYNFMRDSRGGDDGLLNTNYKHQSSHTNAASTKALSDLHSFMRNSAGGDDGFLNPEYKGQSSDTNAATTKALSEFHDFVRGSNGGDEGLLNTQYKDQTSHSNAASTKALTDLYNFTRDARGGDDGLLNTNYKNQSSHTNAASTKALSDLHSFMRNSAGGDDGFLNPEYKGQSSDTNAATTKALSEFHDFVRGSNGGDEGLLNTQYKDQTSHSNAASTKALSDLHDYLRSSDENGYLMRDFSNQTSHSNAATAKSVTDLFNYIIDGFLVKDFTEGNEETAATSGAVFNLFQYMQSSQYIADVLNDNSESKVVSAKTLSNLYYQKLASEDFFKIHNSYIFEDYLKQSINDKSSTQPFSSTATSNVIHDMITERRKLYNALNGDGVLNNQINNNDFGKIATAQSVYYLSNNTRNEINKLNDSIYDSLKKTETNMSIFDRIGLSSSDTNPLEILQTNDCNIDIGLKYNPKYFTLTGSGQFTLDDTAISNIAASAIKIRSSSDNGGFSNLIEVDPVGDGEYEIKFKGTSLLDEISGDVAKSVADAILNYGEGDYTFSCNLWVKQNLTVYSNIRASNVYFSNVEVASNFVSSNMEVSNSLLVNGNATFESNLTILSNLTVSGDAMIEGYQKIASTLSVSENMYVDDEIRIFSNAFIGGRLSVREDLNVSGPAFLDKSLSVADEFFSKSIEIASNALINGQLIANHATTSNLVSKNIETVNTEIMSNLTFTSAYHDVKIYATNPDGSFGNNNLYLEANNVDKIVYSNIRNIVLGEDQSRIYIAGELSTNISSVFNLNVSGPSVFDEVITGTINNTEHVLADKAVESSMTDQRYFPMAIDRTDGDAPFKELHPFSNMYFDKNLNVNIDKGLSVKNTITSGALSVAQLDFDSLGGSVQVHGQNIFGTVPNASNVYVNRIISDTDASYYNLSMVKYDLTHDVLERKNRIIEFGTNMVYQPSENLLSVGQISAENGYNIGKINASALSTGSPVDLNPYINITQDNLLKVDANLSVSHSGESTLANTISVAQKNNTGGYDEQLVFADQENGTLTVRPEVTFEVDGLDYGIKVNTTKVMNSHVYASEIRANTLKVGNTSNDPLYITSDGLVDAREVSAGRLIIQEGSEFSGVGKPGELKFASGKFYGHDGTKFTSISSATVNDEETGMFVTEGKHDIDFRCTSNGTPFDLRLRSNLVNIPNTLSVKDVYVYDNTIVKSLILRDNIKQKKCPSIQMTQNEMSGYVASGSSTLSFQNDYYKCFDGKDVTYDDFDDGTGHYSAWISQTTYDHISGLPLVDASPTFPGTEKRGEFCMLKLPSPILLKQFHIYTRGSATYENATPPKDICLYGTNNGTEWEELGSYKDLIFTGREGLRLDALQLPDTDIEGEYKKFNQFAIQVECITVQGNKPAYCAIGRLDFYTQDDSATYTDLDDRLEGLPGQLVYSDGKILCHDGTSFKQITGSTANMDRTGMFLVEGESNIKFRANSDSNAIDHFDVKFDEEKAEFGSNVLIKNDLSVGGITHGTLKGNADTANSAARLTTPVTINGVDFDGSQSIDISVTADAIRSELDTRYIRKDSDTVASFAWAKSDTPNIKLQNSTHSTWLYLGGADGGTNTDNIARIRSASAGDLVVDSAANANMYLNWYSSGIINLGGYTKVRGAFCVTGDAPNTGYHLILNGLRPTTTSGGAKHFINGPNRSLDGGENTYTIRNDSGNLRLGRSGSTTRIEGNVEFENSPTAGLANSATIEATTADTANKIVMRDNNGDLYGRYLRGQFVNISHARTNRNSDTIFYSSTDNYIRKNTPAGMISSLGLENSATIAATTADTANKIALRDSQGDIFARLFRSDYPNETHKINEGAFAYRVSTGDNYIRFCNDMGQVRSRLGLANSATITASADRGNDTIVRRHSDGYIFSNYINTTDNAITDDVTAIMCKQNSNDYHRSADAGAVNAFLGSFTNFFRRNTHNDVNVRFTAGHGRGVRFWDSDSYKIYMSSATDGTWGGRLDSSDYNMYFRMTGGTTRGFVFLNNRSVKCHINGNGDLYLNGGWLRTYGSRGWYSQSYGGGWFMQDTTYVRCYNDKTVYTGGAFLAGGNVTAYSDIRRKKDLLKIDNALDKVEQLTGYTYTNKNDNKRYTGLIAQDVQKVLPEAVATESDGHLSLAYGNMAGLFVEAIKELTRKNEILEARLNDIENNK